MPVESQEIFIIIIIGTIVALLLVSFIVAILFLYQRKQHRQEQELALLKDRYENELLRSQLEIQESTLKVIAQELHDNIGQTLSVVKFSLSSLPIEKSHAAMGGIGSIKEMLSKAIVDMSNLSWSLHPDRISEIGLTDSIRHELDILKKNGLLEIEYTVCGDENLLEEKKSIFLFRMFQECVNNVLKHSHAKKIIVYVNYAENGFFRMRVEDDGIGFDTEEGKSKISFSGGLGLKNIISRASLIGAEALILSNHGSGTVISIKLPLDQKV
ncbi:MAG TPA: ATP-binding protein [Puia sp.]|nr:ATP-binding protein [Puia sp.]